ncbi:Rv3235 family protein [Bailinhaonella thermotolerans]|uniref:Uncharacterized protein n=1 Tax=Bailinhaonella thermotolerans TaxID=1070861 RepID=A0A3A4BGL8_9ACTN|nr:Rv3235 family protein [Bailinhaonella thermotolerans]RJL30452.1 hypothetical protein D5H75_23065 [Bailinhaonella thermotolerans]
MPRPTRPLDLPRQLPRPVSEPPYDDESARRPLPAFDGALALDLGAREAEPCAAEPAADDWSHPHKRDLRRLAQAVAEVLTGRRTADSVSARLTDQARAELARAGAMIPATRPPLVGQPRICLPRPGVLELCVLLWTGPRRAKALALRLERHGTQWLCTDFEASP